MSFAAVVERLRTLSNPYPGLRPFETSESHLFFGRDRQVAELVGRLERNRFLAIIGVSGSGKSSLVRAGLIPALERGRVLEAGRRWRVVVTRPGASPLASLGADLSRAGFDASLLTRSSHGLIEVAHQLASDESLLVVVDQFEELFRYKDAPLATDGEARRRRGLSADAAAEFVQLLLAAGRDSRPVYIILTMRSDYLGDCAEFRDLPETLNDCQYLIPRMTREQRKQAIEVPLGQVAIAPSLVQRLLNDAGDEPDQLPVLQHALMRTWNHWRRSDPGQSRPIELDDYLAIGGLEHAIDLHAEEVYGAVDQSIAATIFKRLTARGRGNRERRDPATLGELCAICGAATPDARDRVRAVVDAFRLGDATFLTPREGAIAEDDFVDITHESLIRQWRRLHDVWLVEEQQSAKKFLSLIERARDWEAGKAKPLFDLDFADAMQWDARRNETEAWAAHYASAQDHELLGRFLASSRSYDRGQRLRKRGLWVVGPLAFVFAGLSIVAFNQTRQAEAARLVSIAHQMAVKSQLLQNELVSLEPSVLLAVEGMRRLDSANTELALRQAIQRLPRPIASMTFSREGQPDPVSAVSVAPDGRSVAVVTAGDIVKVIDTATWREVSSVTVASEPVAPAIAPGPAEMWTIASATKAGVSVTTMPGGKELRRFPQAGSVEALALSGDARRLAVVAGGEAVVYDIAMGHVMTRFKIGTPTAVAFSEDGRLLAIGNQETFELRLRYFTSVVDVTTTAFPVPLMATTPVRAVDFSRDGRFLVTSTEDGMQRVLNLENFQEPVRFHTGVPTVSMALSDDAHLLLAGSADGSARIFDVVSGDEAARLTHEPPRAPDPPNASDGLGETAPASPPKILAVALSPDGRVAFSGGDDGTLRVFEAAGANDVARMTEALPVTAVAFAKNAQRLVVGSGHPEGGPTHVGVIDAPEWRNAIQLTSERPEMRSIAISSNGRFVAVASNWAGGPWVHDLDDPKKEPIALGGPSLISSVALSGDGTRVAAVSSPSQGLLFDRASGKPLVLRDASFVQAIALSDDGRTVVVGTGNIEGGEAVVRQLPGGDESARVPVIGPALFVATSADGRWAAVSGRAQNPLMRLIDTTAKKILWSHMGKIDTPVAFSPGGDTVAFTIADGTLRTFSTATGAEVDKLFVHHPIAALAFESQNRALVTVAVISTITSRSGVVVGRHILRHEDLIADACARATRDLTASEWAQYVGEGVPYNATCGKGR